MSRKRTKKRKARKGRHSASVKRSVEERQAQGERLLETEQYKEAITLFKELLKEQQRPEWVDALAEAYRGRAQGLADKGMLKEAIVIWRNCAEICHQPPTDPIYFETLFRAGQIETALQQIQTHRDRIEQQGQLPRLRELCGVQVLAGHEGIQTIFPDDDPLMRDFPAAQAALEAYCQGDDGAVERHLKTIPFRSPFRDFRQLLKALLLLDKDAAEMEQQLSRINPGSPYFQLCKAVRAARLPAMEFIRRYQLMGTAERRFAMALRGWAPQQIKRLQELNQLGESPQPNAILRFLLRHLDAFGEEWVREMGIRFLIHENRAEKSYSKAFGPLPLFQRMRIDALSLEEDGATPSAIYNSWYHTYIEWSKSRNNQDPDSAMIGATILRHKAECWLLTETANEQVLNALDLSLKLDPHDLPTHLRLIRLYREQNRMKDARRIQEKALSRYPQNSEVLTEAVETSIAGNAFKKAARFAHQALELDPINSRVRNILVESHLAHARKQIGQEKLALARKELDEASSWTRTEVNRGQVELVRGVLELKAGDIDSARRLFLTGYEQAGGELSGRFHLLMEAGRMRYDLKSFMRQARLPKPPGKPDRKQLLALIQILNELHEQDKEPDLLDSTIEFLTNSLKGADKQAYSVSEMELICETWLRLDQSELRLQYAKAALKQWPDTPVLLFHRHDAAIDEFMELSSKDFHALEDALGRARDEGDMRTSHRIDGLLRDYFPFGGPGVGAFDPFDDDDIPPDLPEGLNMERLLDLMVELGGDEGFRELQQKLGLEEFDRQLKAVLSGDMDPSELGQHRSHEPARPRQPGKKPRKKLRKSNPDQFDLF